MTRLARGFALVALALLCLPGNAVAATGHTSVAQAPTGSTKPAKPAVFRRQYLVFFEIGSATLSESGKRIVAAVAAAVKQRSYSHLKVIGYSDAPGSAAAAQKISEQRAAVVREALIRRGVPADKLRSEGRGKHNPAVKTAAAEPRNRRVRIIVYLPGE